MVHSSRTQTRAADNSALPQGVVWHYDYILLYMITLNLTVNKSYLKEIHVTAYNYVAKSVCKIFVNTKTVCTKAPCQ